MHVFWTGSYWTAYKVILLTALIGSISKIAAQLIHMLLPYVQCHMIIAHSLFSSLLVTQGFAGQRIDIFLFNSEQMEWGAFRLRKILSSSVQVKGHTQKKSIKSHIWIVYLFIQFTFLCCWNHIWQSYSRCLMHVSLKIKQSALTPNLCRLTIRGVLFLNVWCSTPC